MVDSTESPAATETDESNSVTLAIGDVVHDREDDNPNDAVVINNPQATASEWIAYRKKTVADDNPDYPEDAPVVVVIYDSDLRRVFPDWSGDAPLKLTKINETDVTHYSYPVPRLKQVGSLSDNGKTEQTDAGTSDESSTENNERETAATEDTADEDTSASDDTPVTAADLSASMRALKERLEDGGMAVEIEPDGKALQTTKLGDTYRVRPGKIIEGDGALRPQLEPIVAEYE